MAAVGAFRVVPEHDLDIDHDTLSVFNVAIFLMAVWALFGAMSSA